MERFNKTPRSAGPVVLLGLGLLLVFAAGCLAIGSPDDIEINVLEETPWIDSSKMKIQALNTGYFPVKNVEVLITYYKLHNDIPNVPPKREVITTKMVQFGTIDPGEVVTKEVTTRYSGDPTHYSIRVKGASLFK